MSQATRQSNLSGHVAVFAFPFGSHAMSLLNLALKLALEVHEVGFLFFNTAKSNSSLFQGKRYQILPSNFKAYDVEDGVPTGHILSGVLHEEVDLFLKAAPENLKKALDLAVSETGAKLTCLLTDALLTFSGDLYSAPWITVWCTFPCSLSAHLYTDLIRDRFAGCASGIEDMSLEFVPGLSDMKVGDLPGDVLAEARSDSLLVQALSQTGIVLPRDCAALVLGFYETLSPRGLSEDLKSKFRKVLHVGLFTQSASPSEPNNALISWLDEQKERSVAYVSFGTAVELPRSEMIALAEALEESNVPFIWSVKDHLKADLPEGFEERTSLRAKLVPWAPQQQVLRHRSVGVFVTQGGFNSVYESIDAKVPMICRPVFGDHHMLVRLVEDVWKIGVRIEPKMFTKNEVIKGLDLILGQEEGKMMGKRVTKLKETVLEAAAADGSAAEDFKTLVEIVSSVNNSVPAI